MHTELLLAVAFNDLELSLIIIGKLTKQIGCGSGNGSILEEMGVRSGR